MDLIIPILLALGRALRGLGKAGNRPDFKFGWYRFFGSLIIAVIVGLALQFGFDVTSLFGLIVVLAGAWLGTDFIEDLLRYLAEEPQK